MHKTGELRHLLNFVNVWAMVAKVNKFLRIFVNVNKSIC